MVLRPQSRKQDLKEDKMAEPDVWDETAKVVIYDMTNTVNMNIDALTETIDIDEGDKEGESIATIKGGRLWKKTSEADTTLTFEGYPISIGSATSLTPKGLIQFFESGSDATEPLAASSSLTRTKFRVTMLWTDDTGALNARDSVASGSYALRYDFQNCYFISCKPSFTDKVLKATWKFKLPTFTKAKVANITVESVEGGAAMPSIPVVGTKTLNGWAVIT